MMKIKTVLKSVLSSYVVTGLLLLLLTFLISKFELQEKVVETSVTSIYLISTFTGGFIAGKVIGKRKFLWGILVGCIYIGLLCGVSHMLYGEVNISNLEGVIPMILCIGGGMFGGMLA